MSQESFAVLNTRQLIGFTDKRGRAWHYRADAQGDEPNHYPGAIPFDDVLRRLFAWQPAETQVAVNVPVLDATSNRSATLVPATIEDFDFLDKDGQPFKVVVHDFAWQVAADRKGICADDNYDLLGLFKDGYAPHSYREWLLNNVAHLLDSDLEIGSAGLLRNRAVAYVQVEVPESITTPEGVAFRPHLTACTSLDGSLATVYKKMVTVVVCDNTLAAGLREDGPAFRVKHTRNSGLRIKDAREALDIVFKVGDEFSEQVRRLCDQTVTDAEFAKLVNRLVPVKDGASVRSSNMAEKKRGELHNLWENDSRVNPWAHTAFGAVQAFNTYSHHVQMVRGSSRSERNTLDALTGAFEKQDAEVLAVLADIQSAKNLNDLLGVAV